MMNIIQNAEELQGNISLYLSDSIKYTLLTRYDAKEGKGLEVDNRDTRVG